jgi:hypothetical protein
MNTTTTEVPSTAPGLTLIGLCGLAYTGKDATADILCSQYGFERAAFADPIREMLEALLEPAGISTDYLYTPELKDEPIPGLLVSGRQLMQTLGSEWGRHQVDGGLWVNIAARRLGLHKLNPTPVAERIVITDCRFANEAATVRKLGGEVWQVVRAGVPNVEGGHASQNDGTNLQPDLALYNGQSINDLRHSTLRALVLRHGGLVLPDDLQGATA